VFEIGEYDRSRPLVIDPVVLGFQTYIGGSGSDDARGVAHDNLGTMHVVGRTDLATSFTFASGTTTSVQGGPLALTGEAYIVAYDRTGTALWATIFGGAGADEANGIDMYQGNDCIVVGRTASGSGFPTQATPFAAGGGIDGFVAAVASGGTLIYSSLIGGSATDSATAVAVGAGGDVFMTGLTSSAPALFMRSNR
jgi:hypothetical protein